MSFCTPALISAEVSASKGAGLVSGTWKHLWQAWVRCFLHYQADRCPTRSRFQLTGHLVMSSGHSWGSSEEGSSHTLHETSVWSGPGFPPIYLHTPRPQQEAAQKHGLTWGPGDRQSQTVSCGHQVLGHWDEWATSPTLPTWTAEDIGQSLSEPRSLWVGWQGLPKAETESKTSLPYPHSLTSEL